MQNFLISILAVHFGATIIVNGLRSSKFMVGTCQSQLSVVLSLIWRRQASPSHLTPLSQATHNRVVIVFVFLQESFFSTGGALVVITVSGISTPSIHSRFLLRRASANPIIVLIFPNNICRVSQKNVLIEQNHKVNRCLARYSPRATTTNRPTNRALNKPAWPGPN